MATTNSLPFNDSNVMAMPEIQGQETYFTDTLSDIMFPHGTPTFNGVLDQQFYTHGPMISPRSMISSGDQLYMQKIDSYIQYHSSVRASDSFQNSNGISESQQLTCL
jgi:hypothetical protein